MSADPSDHMPDRAPAWVVPVMRAGYSARAIVYTIVGALAVTAAWQGGQAEGTTDAVAQLRQAPYGQVLMWVVALGLLAYMVWRLIDAIMDLDDYGSGAKGIFARGALVVTGLIHGALGLSVASAAMGGGSGSGGGGTESATQKLMTMPYGVWLVALAGALTLGAGGYYVYKGVAERYKEHIRVTPTTRKLDPVMKFGCIAEGAVVGIIGILILFAAATADPSQAGGVGEALGQIRSVAFGRILLAIVGLGLIAFAVENVVEAIYRVIPRRAGSDVMTLARRARLKAEGKLQAATS